jgi:hypothetical protein
MTEGERKDNPLLGGIDGTASTTAKTREFYQLVDPSK